MKDNVEMVLLYHIYKDLLATKQKEIFEEYYLYNLSLREIADNRNITYQAVSDSINKTENLLLNFEAKIGMKELKYKVHNVYKLIKKQDDLNSIKEKLLNELKLDISEDDI